VKQKEAGKLFAGFNGHKIFSGRNDNVSDQFVVIILAGTRENFYEELKRLIQ